MITRPVLFAGAAVLICGATAGRAAEPWTLHAALGAPDELRISGSFRTRYETISNQFRAGANDEDDLVELRTTLFAEYDAGPVRIGGEMIDARIYDADAGSPVGTGEVNALELVQAYLGADLGDALGEGSATSLDLGRFILDFGSRRLVGRNAFGNTSTGYTGARADWRGRGSERATLFFTLPQVRLPSDKPSILDNDVEWDRESSDLIFWGGFANLPGVTHGAGLDLYFFALDEDDSASTPTRNRQLYTPGFRFFRAPRAGAWDFEVEAAFQFGNIRASNAADAPEQSVSAFTVHAELGRKFGGPWAPRVRLEYDHATGDRSGGAYGRFDPLFGPRRADWGPGGLYGPLGRANIVSPGARLDVTPGPRWDAFIGYRAAWLDSATDAFASTGIRDPSGGSGDFAGHQIEARVRYWIVPGLLQLDVGGVVLIDGRFLEDAPNASGNGDTVYGYSDLTLTF